LHFATSPSFARGSSPAAQKKLRARCVTLGPCKVGIFVGNRVFLSHKHSAKF
jgi:hypothetical protein